MGEEELDRLRALVHTLLAEREKQQLKLRVNQVFGDLEIRVSPSQLWLSVPVGSTCYIFLHHYDEEWPAAVSIVELAAYQNLIPQIAQETRNIYQISINTGKVFVRYENSEPYWKLSCCQHNGFNLSCVLTQTDVEQFVQSFQRLKVYFKFPDKDMVRFSYKRSGAGYKLSRGKK